MEILQRWMVPPQAAVVPQAGPTSAVNAGAVNFLQPPSGGGGGGGGGGPGGGAGGSGGGNNITIVRSRRTVANNQNAGTELNSAMNSAATMTFTRPPSSTQSASLIPRRSSIHNVTPIAFTSPTRLTSSAPLQQESVHFSSPEPSRRMTSRGTPSRFTPAHAEVTPATATVEVPPRPRMSTPDGLTPYAQNFIDGSAQRTASLRARYPQWEPQAKSSSQTNTALVEALRAGRELEAQDKRATRSRTRSQTKNQR